MDDSGGDGVARYGASSSSSSLLPDRLFYDPPRREDYPHRRSSSSSWRDGLFDVLSSLEESMSLRSGGGMIDYDDNPIVLYGNDKYVCIYDMVR